MRKRFLILALAGIISISNTIFSQLIDTSVLSMDLLPEVTEQTIDAAYKAPMSKLYGIWYFHTGNGCFQINPDGKGVFSTLTDEYNGIGIVSQQQFLWKKENGKFRVKFVGEARCTLAEKDQAKYEKLTRNEKDALMSYFKSLSPHSMSSQPIESKIEFLNQDNMIWSEGGERFWLVNKKYLSRLEKEAKQPRQPVIPVQPMVEEVEVDEVITAVPIELIEDEVISESDENVYTAPDHPGEFPGGAQALIRWISNNLRYPEAAQQNDIQGRVVVKFIVEKDGSVSNPQVAISVDKDLDREALRLVNKMPKWQPATKNGRPVRSYYNLPVTFKLQ